ncbi:MAG: ABC transporter permease [Chloroflexi bacterium]|nr:ABC transporter permease [Chloroflexota bacterium]
MRLAPRPIVYDSAAPDGGLPTWCARVWAARELVWVLAQRDVKARYRQSILGIYWTVLNPLATAAVFTVVFSFVVRVPTGGTPYPVFVLCGLLAWNFFANSLASATGSLVGLSALVAKVSFPREALPVAAVVARLVDLGCALLVLHVVMLAWGLPPRWTLLLVPFILAIEGALVTGLGLLAAAGNLFYRDVGQLLSIVLSLWMFLTPVLYPSELIPPHLRPLFLLNPLVPIVDALRRTILVGQLPDGPELVLAAALSLVTLIGGYALFKRLEPLFAETA